MADRMTAEIWIGGKLSSSLLKEFPVSDLKLDWDETPLDASSEENILNARDENGLLHFADCEAAWGQFEELEDWLREHNIPFRRQSAGKYEYFPTNCPENHTLPQGDADAYTGDPETLGFGTLVPKVPGKHSRRSPMFANRIPPRADPGSSNGRGSRSCGNCCRSRIGSKHC